MTLSNSNFNILPPLSITETELISGIPDAENEVYSSSEIYDAGDRAWDSGHVWEALQVVGERNLLTHTENFDNAAWGKTNGTIIADAITAPDGTETADKIIEDFRASGTTNHFVEQTASAQPAGTYTFSVYWHEFSERTLQLYVQHTGDTSATSTVTLARATTGGGLVTLGLSAVTGNGVSANLEELDDGWWRISLTLTTTDTRDLRCLLVLFDDASIAYTGNGTSGALLWGAQLEEASGANPYQKILASYSEPARSENSYWTDLGEVDQGASAYASGTTYNIDDYAVYEGQLWRCAADATTGVTPSITASEWTRQGATNRLKAFDGFLQDAASLSGNIRYTLEFSERVTSVSILRAVGASATITMTEDTAGVVYNETFPLLDVSSITNWYEYFFYQPAQFDTVIAETLPPYTGATINVEITGDNVSVGQVIAGNPRRVGVVKVGTSVGIESYSIKERDEFNRSIVVPRPYSDTVSFNLAINAQQVGWLKRQLALMDAQETLYYMSDGSSYGAIAYGFFRDFEILHSTAVVADCVLEIEGLG